MRLLDATAVLRSEHGEKSYLQHAVGCATPRHLPDEELVDVQPQRLPRGEHQSAFNVGDKHSRILRVTHRVLGVSHGSELLGEIRMRGVFSRVETVRDKKTHGVIASTAFHIP